MPTVERAGLEPGPELLADLARLGVAAQQREEQHEAEHEGQRRHRGAEEVAVLVGGRPERGRQERRDTEQQDRAEHRERDDQPEQVEHTARAHVGRDHGRVGALLGHRQAGSED